MSDQKFLILTGWRCMGTTPAAEEAAITAAAGPKDLVLPLKAEYFDAIQAGTKTEEFRLCTPYWRKRLEGQTFARVVLTKGYPPAADASRRLVREWRGYRETTITHPHFGAEPVQVFAIDVSKGGAS